MLRDGRPTDGQVGGQPAYRAGLPSELLENQAPSRVTEGGEGIDRCAQCVSHDLP
jgi:hypothetical protein